MLTVLWRHIYKTGFSGTYEMKFPDFLEHSIRTSNDKKIIHCAFIAHSQNYPPHHVHDFPHIKIDFLYRTSENASPSTVSFSPSPRQATSTLSPHMSSMYFRSRTLYLLTPMVQTPNVDSDSLPSSPSSSGCHTVIPSGDEESTFVCVCGREIVVPPNEYPKEVSSLLCLEIAVTVATLRGES